MKRWNETMDGYMYPPQGAGKPPEPVKRYCEWRQDLKDRPVYDTQCGQYFVFTNVESPEDTGMKFCCFCGKNIKGK